jgi:hypothetical protein
MCLMEGNIGRIKAEALSAAVSAPDSDAVYGLRP